MESETVHFSPELSGKELTNLLALVKVCVREKRAVGLTIRFGRDAIGVVTVQTGSAEDQAAEALPIHPHGVHPLVRLRLRAGMTKGALAKLTGISSRQLGRIESGACAPHERNVDRLMNALSLSPTDADIVALKKLREKKSGRRK